MLPRAEIAHWLFALVGLLFSLVVAPGLVDDLERREPGDAAAG